MTITPEKAKELTQNERKQICQLEKQIDATLTESFHERKDGIIVDLDCTSPRIIDELIRMYDGAGWNVQEKSDQRDGDYLVFQAKKNYQGGSR
jgi:hypothetical protein